METPRTQFNTRQDTEQLTGTRGNKADRKNNLITYEAMIFFLKKNPLSSIQLPGIHLRNEAEGLQIHHLLLPTRQSASLTSTNVGTEGAPGLMLPALAPQTSTPGFTIGMAQSGPWVRASRVRMRRIQR